MLERIGEMEISDEWAEIFTRLCLDRGFRHIDGDKLAQMQQIADTDSKAVAWLAQQDKRAGLEMLERLSVKVTDEQLRAKAVQVMLTHGIKQSKRELDLIIAAAGNTPNLFDHKETMR